MMTRSRLHDLLWLLLVAVYFVFLSQYRLIDRDEGYYFLAAKEVMRGRIPYLDFFYPQMPLFPYVYGAWMKIFGETWASARLLSALCCTLLSFLIYKHITWTKGSLWGTIGAALFMTANFAFPWFSIGKTFALSGLFLFLSYFLLVHDLKLRPGLRYFLAGACFSFAVQTRLFFGGLLPIFIVYVYYFGSPKEARIRNTLQFIFGGALVSIPLLVLLAKDPKSFLYNNLTYHLLRSARIPEEAEREKRHLLGILFGFINPVRDRGIHFPMLLYGSLLFAGLSAWKRRLPGFAWTIALSLFLLNLLPTPSYLQYFSALAPFLVISALAVFWEIRSMSPRWIFVALALLTLVRWASIFPSEVSRHLVTGKNILGVGTEKRAEFFRLSTMEAITMKLDAMTTPDDTIITLWPGFVLETHARIYPRFENHFGFTASLRVSRDEIKKFHLPSVPYLLRSIAEGKAALVITIPGSESIHLKGALVKGGYELRDSFPGGRIYGLTSRRGASAPSESGNKADRVS